MTFDDFIEKRVPREHNYSWDVEQGAMSWKTAGGGLQTVERKLHELRAINDE